MTTERKEQLEGQAKEYFDQGDWVNARKCYLELYREGNRQKKNVYRLVQLDLKLDLYQEARTILEQIDSKEPCFLKTSISLETNEYNFKTAEKIIYSFMQKDNNQVEGLKLLLGNSLNRGEYDTARKIASSLLFDREHYFKAFQGLVQLDILTGDYEKAFYQLNRIDPLRLQDRQVKAWYNYCSQFICKRLNLEESSELAVDNYRHNIVLHPEQNKEMVIQHIQKHELGNENNQSEFSSFFALTDYAKLYDVVRNKMKMSRQVYSFQDSQYALPMETPIGVIDGKISSDIGVASVFDQEEIITMYPISLSKDFNKDGYCYQKKMGVK